MKTSPSITSPIVRKLLLLLPFAITGCFVAAMYIHVTTPVYESTVIIKAPEPDHSKTSLNIFPDHQSEATEEISSTPFIQTALQQSGALIEYYTTSDFKTVSSNYTFPFQITFNVMGNSNYQPQHYNIQKLNNNAFELQSTLHGITRTKQGKFGEEIMDNNLALTITLKKQNKHNTDFLISKPTYSFIIHSPASLAEQLTSTANAISVKDNDGVITLKVPSKNPQYATLLASTLAHSFLNKTDQIQINNQATTSDENLNTVAKQLATTEAEILKYKRENYLIDIESETEKTMSIFKDLQSQKTDLQLQMAALDNLSNYLRKNREVNNSQVEYGVIQDPSFSQQIEKLNDAYTQKHSGKSNSNIDTEIENIKLLISERILNTRKKTAVQIDRINQTISQTQNRIAKIPEQANTLLALERKMQLDKKVYEMLIEKKALSIVGTVGSSNQGKILKPATQPTAASWPLNWLILTLGITGGLVCGVLFQRMRSATADKTVQNAEELATLSGIPFIATVSNTQNVKSESSSAVSNLCSAILMKTNTKIITFASLTNGEGKTFIATNLAQSLAALDKKVLLLDMNIHQPALSAQFSITTDYNLSNVLDGTCDVHDAIHLTSFPNLEVMSAGAMPFGINTLLSSKKRSSILSTIKDHYDYIIIDTPGINTSGTSIAMMQMSDLNLYVVRSNSTKKSTLLSAEQLCADHKIEKVHFVLNTEDVNSLQPSYQKQRIRKRKINVTQHKQPKNSNGTKPSLLKRIALWFY